MNLKISRRKFLQTSAFAASSFALGANVFGKALKNPDSFSFPFLGDVHIDKMSFHDADSIRDHGKAFKAYDKMTANMTPKLFSTVRETIIDLNKNSATQVPFVIQVGDLVDGYCGTSQLALEQSKYGLDFIERAKLPSRFLFTKGNHDVAGKGAHDAYQKVFLPFLSQQLAGVSQKKTALQTAYYSVEHGNALFLFFDAYDKTASLNWMETTLARSKARHVFVIIHPPVVPYGVRPNWTVFPAAAERNSRARLLNLLGKYNAIVLSGHLHKYNCMVRQTESGKFLQLSVSSVLHTEDFGPGNVLSGVKNYTPEQVNLDPNYEPEKKDEHRAMYQAEMPFVKHFDYASQRGYAVIDVEKDNVQIKIYSGYTRQVWKTLDVGALLAS